MAQVVIAAGELRDWVLILPVIVSLLGAALTVMVGKRQRLAWLIAAAAIGLVLVSDCVLLQRVTTDGPFAMTMGNWRPPFGITFTGDALGALFALTAAFVSAIVLVVTRSDRDVAGDRGVLPQMLVLLGGASGAVLTGDLFNLYVWFEVMLVSSFGLMVVGGRAVQLDGALKYGVLNLIGTTLFLVALGLLYGLLGTLNMADIARRTADAPAAPMLAIAALLLLAFGTKAAVFPVQAWLPASYHTPPPAIAALVGGVLTKIGVYALLRTLIQLLPESRTLMEPAIAIVAIMTLVLAPLGALAVPQMRRALGFLAIGGVGSMLAGLALGTPIGISGAVVYGIGAIVLLTALFCLAGAFEVLTGQTDTARMGGLYRREPLFSGLFFLALFSVAGMPPFLGFWPKLLLLQAGWERAGAGGWLGGALVAALLLNAVLTLFAAGRIWLFACLRQPDAAIPAAKGLRGRKRLYLALPLIVLMAAASLLGVWPQPLFGASTLAAAQLLDPQGTTAAVALGDAP